MAPIKSDYVEQRNGGYYVADSRVSLDSVVYAFRRGEAPETILDHFRQSALWQESMEQSLLLWITPKRLMHTSQRKNGTGRRRARQTLQ